MSYSKYHSMSPAKTITRENPRVDPEEILDWDYALEVAPPAKRSGTIEVILKKALTPCRPPMNEAE